MADLTQLEIQTAIAAIHTQLQSLVTNPSPSYKDGEHEYKWNEYQKMLMEQLTMYRGMLASLPAEEATLWREW